MLRTHIHIEEIRLRYLEKEQIRMVEEQEQRFGTQTGTDEFFPQRILFLPGNRKTSTAYLKRKRLDLNAMVA